MIISSLPIITNHNVSIQENGLIRPGVKRLQRFEAAVIQRRHHSLNDSVASSKSTCEREAVSPGSVTGDHYGNKRSAEHRGCYVSGPLLQLTCLFVIQEANGWYST